MKRGKVKRQKKTEKKNNYKMEDGKTNISVPLRGYLMGAGPGAEGGGHLAWTRDWREVSRHPPLLNLEGGGG